MGCGGATGIQLFRNSLQWQTLAYTDNKADSFSKVLCYKATAPPPPPIPTLLKTEAVFVFEIAGTVY
jgi:hypothetical protein